ncbi:MAG TPA: hypothetical protein VKY26_06090, partial [Actinomycetota bacterium]|nr:hypothetical protein [Actinomycetota bacterium]
ASGPHLRATRIAQSRAHRAGLPVPRPLFEELQTIGTTDALVAVDEYLPAAPPADARDPAVRRKLAEMLAVFIQEMSLVATDPELSRSRLVYPVDGDLWPTPHSPVFDFESSREGAGWIDEFALAAKARMRSRHGEVKTGHADWRVFNVRPASGSSPAAIYDLDSVIRDHEPLLVGRACAGYTTGGPYFELPRFSQALEFLRDYEECSGRCFSATERREVMAMAAYHLAYVARCAHSLEHSRGTASAPPREGSSREILLSEGAEWLSWDGELDPTISPRAS